LPIKKANKNSIKFSQGFRPAALTKVSFGLEVGVFALEIKQRCFYLSQKVALFYL